MVPEATAERTASSNHLVRASMKATHPGTPHSLFSNVFCARGREGGWGAVCSQVCSVRSACPQTCSVLVGVWVGGRRCLAWGHRSVCVRLGQVLRLQQSGTPWPDVQDGQRAALCSPTHPVQHQLTQQSLTSAQRTHLELARRPGDGLQPPAPCGLQGRDQCATSAGASGR